MKKLHQILFLFGLAFLVPVSASAHEVYVLSKEQIVNGMSYSGLNIFDSLRNPSNIQTFFLISVPVTLVFIANFFFRRSALGKKATALVERGHVFGPLFVRVAVAASFFFSAETWSFLGPELSLHDFPYGGVIRILLYILSAMFLLGVFVEIAAVVGLALFALAIYQYHWYMLSYFNYFGEFIVLILFGLRVFSVDQLLFGKGGKCPHLEKYKTTVVRICYGIALAFAAIYVKFLHAALTLEVVNFYDLTRFHLLFPHDPLFVVFGAALSELAIAVCIIIGCSKQHVSRCFNSRGGNEFIRFNDGVAADSVRG